MNLKQWIQKKDRFLVVAELVPLPGHRLTNMEQFLQGYKDKKEQVPENMPLVGVSLPQSPGGVASMSPADIYAAIEKKPGWQGLDVMAHVTTKDHNTDAIKSYLIGLHKQGVQTVLALTGDKPAESKGVFEVDSVGLIRLVKEMNYDFLAKAKPGQFDQAKSFFIAAAVSPFKYTEASQMQQYYKMAKKVRAGAQCLITQMGWDWRKSSEFFRYMKEEGIHVPVFGNVYLLSTMTPAPRLMYQGKLPGCLVTKELFEKVKAERPEDHIERAAQQVAMYKDLGAAGVDVGGILDFDMLVSILRRAEEIGADWKNSRQNLEFGVPGGFYLYDQNDRRRPPSRSRATINKRMFDLFHKSFFEPGRGLYRPICSVLKKSKSLQKGQGGLYHFFHAGMETPIKKLLFSCEECGDCFLYENFSICSIGKCEKGLDNPPCGDANADGTCGNNEEIRCVGELIYEAASSEGQKGLERLAREIHPNRNPALEGTASILNYFYGKDHTKKVNLIQIGESVHASIPKPGAAMKELWGKGPGSLETPSGVLDYMISLIESQIDHQADYIEVNVDAFGEDDPQQAVQMMEDYVRLVRRHSRGVPVCVDSSSDDVLEAGLKAWYEGAEGNQTLQKPLLNSVKTYTIDKILPLNKTWPFKVIGLLVDDHSAGTDGSYGQEELYQMARKIFDAAVKKYGFKPDDLYFDSTVFPLAIDMPMMPDTPGYTYRAFQAIRRIMSDPEMKGVHTSLGISNCVKDLPGRRIGVCRAYLAKAQEYGLDAAIVNVLHDYGQKPVADDLMQLVNAFAQQDGTTQTSTKAMELMGQFCRDNRKSGH